VRLGSLGSGVGAGTGSGGFCASWGALFVTTEVLDTIGRAGDPQATSARS